MRLPILGLLLVALACPDAGAVPATNGKRKASVARGPRAGKRVPRCRPSDPFCTTQVLKMDGAEAKGLSDGQIAATVDQHRKRMEGCLVEARRRDPRLAQVKLEFVVLAKGTVLASRVDGRRGTPLARCLHKQLRSVRFPRSTAARSVASVTLSVPQ